MRKSEKGTNSVKFYRILPKVSQVIYTLDTICEPNIMNLAQTVLEIFCSQGSIGLQWEGKTKRATTLQQQVRRKRIFKLIPHVKFQDPTSNPS